jgi:hypothetical protein
MSDINNIPCKQLKCILYPACKHKTAINCNTLSDFLNVYMNIELKIDIKELGPYHFEIDEHDANRFWMFIRKHLPSAERVIVHNIWVDRKNILTETNIVMELSKNNIASFKLITTIKKEVFMCVTERMLKHVGSM